MKHWPSVLMVAALSLAAFGQHGSAHGGVSGHSGFSGHGGFSGHSGFAGPSSFSGPRGFSRPSGFASGRGVMVRPSQPFRYSRFGPTAFRGPALAVRSGMRLPYGNHGSDTRRPAYRPSHHGNSHEGWDRDRHDRRRSWAFGPYGYGYPGWAGYSPYPFVIDPGFYDWDDTDQGV